MNINPDNPWMRSLMAMFLVMSLLMITGCKGCRDQPQTDSEIAEKKKEEEKKKKKKKPDFETRKSVLLPGYFPDAKEKKEGNTSDPLANAMERLNEPSKSKNRTKLGHWYSSNNLTLANNFNFEGQLAAYPIDATGRALPIPATNYSIATTRPVSLPKGEWKNLEIPVFLPPRDIHVRSVSVQYSLNRGTGGVNLIPNLFDSTGLMKPYQYHVVLLSNRPDSYKFLELTDTFHLRDQATTIAPFYLLVPTEPEKPFPLPANALNMTTVAYLIWDDYDPGLLDSEHQAAILDWIHFGGQLILSGPDCLDQLQTSFLADYLPAHFDGARNLTNLDLADLNSNWALPGKTNLAAKRTLTISDQTPLIGVTFKPHDDSNFVDGTGEMVIERRIGRGRIVATAFPINAPVVRKWRSFKSFLNGALLRRPSRHFDQVASEGFGEISFEWDNDGTLIFDPLVHSTLRFLSRDLTRKAMPTPRQCNGDWIDDDRDNRLAYVGGNPKLRIRNSHHINADRNLNDHWHYGGYQDTAQLGTAGWNDNSGISLAARQTLQEAAGITPPSSGFVLKMLVVYLIVLVPVNWLIFRFAGRVEFAWIAAPLISIIGAVLVVKMASLDIGFVRSNTQIGLLEIHSDYSRGHLAEYSALYTSLSTRYDAELDNLTTQSMPFAKTDRLRPFVPEEQSNQVLLRRTNKNRLEGFQIQSNSTGMLHTESMLDLNGVIAFAPATPENESPWIGNSTNIDLTDVGVIRRTHEGDYQIAWIGEFPAGSESNLRFESTTESELGDAWRELPDFHNTLQTSMKIWADNVATGSNPKLTETVTLDELKQFPELQTNWPDYQQLFLQLHRDPEFNWSARDFNDAYQVLNGVSTTTVGRLFDSVIGSLTLAPGECRLIGATRQALGKTSFEPQSTQVDQQTLVVVHLQRPRLPTARPDVNAYEDFKIVSDLDRDRELQELDQSQENQ